MGVAFDGVRISNPQHYGGIECLDGSAFKMGKAQVRLRAIERSHGVSHARQGFCVAKHGISQGGAGGKQGEPSARVE